MKKDGGGGGVRSCPQGSDPDRGGEEAKLWVGETKLGCSELGMITSQGVEGWEEEEQAGVEVSPQQPEKYLPSPS